MRQLALLACLWGSLLASQHAAPADDAAKQYQEGRKAERAGGMVRAFLLPARAAALGLPNQFYWVKSQGVQSRAALGARPKLPEAAAKIDRGTPADTAAAFDPLS